MMHQILLLSLISLDVLILLLQTTHLSISSHEAELLYGAFSFVQFFEIISFKVLGQNDIALRLPMILLHTLSVILLYDISKKYLPEKRNRLWHILFFILLPGVVSSALMVDHAGFIIFGLLVYVYIYEKFGRNFTYIILVFFSILDSGFLYLFMSLLAYSVYKKDGYYFTINSIALSISIYLYGLKIHGTPEGHLLDTIGLYSAIFTPIIFMYLFYILYRKLLAKDINILWFISSVPLVVSILFSLRQNIYIEDFAPYLLLAMPLAAQSFSSSYKIRLKIFRGKYKAIFIISLIFLVINFLVVVLNKELYVLIEKPEKHFARKMHIAKELAQKLKSRNITCITTDKKMMKRLRFYGIEKCDKFLLYEEKLNSPIRPSSVIVNYKHRLIYKSTVTILNTANSNFKVNTQ